MAFPTMTTSPSDRAPFPRAFFPLESQTTNGSVGDSFENLDLGTSKLSPPSAHNINSYHNHNYAQPSTSPRFQGRQQQQENEYGQRPAMTPPARPQQPPPPLPPSNLTRRLRTTQTRNYKLFPGNNRFFCGGRFVTSRAYWAFLLALLVLIAPSVLFAVFMQVSPPQSQFARLSICILTQLHCIVALGCGLTSTQQCRSFLGTFLPSRLYPCSKHHGPIQG